jgi:hypothetical protein
VPVRNRSQERQQSQSPTSSATRVCTLACTGFLEALMGSTSIRPQAAAETGCRRAQASRQAMHATCTGRAKEPAGEQRVDRGHVCAQGRSTRPGAASAFGRSPRRPRCPRRVGRRSRPRSRRGLSQWCRGSTPRRGRPLPVPAPAWATTTETHTRTGSCPTHGTVEATKEMPRPGFPFVVYAARRLVAQRQPFRCPTCGAPVTTS